MTTYTTDHRILITGGAGLIGSHLTKAFLDRGCHVTVVDNFITGSRQNLPSHPRLNLVEADVSQELPVGEEPFDLVAHFACPASPVDFKTLPIEILRVDSLGTFNAMDRAVADGARFLMASTSETYGDPEVHPQPETYWGNVNPVGPRSCYDEAKRFSEAATMAYKRNKGLDASIVRIFNTYGPNMRPDDGRVVPTFIQQALDNQPLTVHGTGTQTRSLCYVDDLITGLIALAESAETGPINLGSTFELSVTEIAETILKLTGSASEINYVPRPEDDPERRRPDLTLAREKLGYEPHTSYEAGLKSTIDYFRTCREEVH